MASKVEPTDVVTIDESVVQRMYELELRTGEPIEDILEKRIALLERKIFGSEGPPSEDIVPENTIIERIEHANTLLSSALSGREKLNALVQRLPEIEEIMESDLESTDVELESKVEYILAMEPEIRKFSEMCKKLEELMPVLDTDRFKSIPEQSEKLHALTLDYIKLGERSNEVTMETRDLISRYNDIITNISKSLISLDLEVSELEKAAEPKKVVD